MWKCENCSAMNPPENERCGMCRQPRDTVSSDSAKAYNSTRFCKYCGKPLNAEQALGFCPYCGKSLGAEIKKPKKSNCVPIIVFATVIIAIAVVGIVKFAYRPAQSTSNVVVSEIESKKTHSPSTTATEALPTPTPTPSQVPTSVPVAFDSSKLLFEIKSNYAVCTGYTGNALNVVIPTHYQGFPVTEIGEYAFSRMGIESIDLPEGITKIGEYAFYECYLQEVEIPSSVRSIGDWAFAQCFRLEKIHITEGVQQIGVMAFKSCPISTFYIPASLTEITGTFLDNLSLLSIDVAEGNPSYASIDGVLYSKKLDVLYHYPVGRTDPEFSVPRGVKKIEWGAFACMCNKGLLIVKLPSTVTRIEAGAFSYFYDFFNDSLNYAKIYIPSSATYIDPNAFLESFCILYAPSGSAAQRYAENYGQDFEAYDWQG